MLVYQSVIYIYNPSPNGHRLTFPSIKMMAMLIDVNNIVEVSKKWKFMVILGGLKKNRYPGGPGTSQDDVVFLNGNFMDDIRTCTCFDHVFNLFVCISYIYIYIHTRSHTVSLSLSFSLSLCLSLSLSVHCIHAHMCIHIYIYTHMKQQ